ncbi:MAG: cyclopropane-fatty-acyl-phospholipid synthase family protein [Azospirillaceae bacterium]
MRLLDRMLSRFVTTGSLSVIDADGGRHAYGRAGEAPHAVMRIHDRRLYRALVLNPELKLAEAYMDGAVTFEEGTSVKDFLTLFSRNRSGLGKALSQSLLRRFWKFMRRRHQHNDVRKAKRQARHHYDLKTDLYRLFLDEELNYSCAYFPTRDVSLEEAQRAKHRHAISKLALEPGMSVLEIGGGWGAFAIHLARAGARVTSLNVSPEQIAIARERVAEAGLDDRVTFVEKDYREFEGAFDRVVSVGMMEHVGIGYLDAFFARVRDLLAPRGFAFIHSIGRMSPPGTTGPFYRKYIFPGGYVPALSETFAALERQGLWVADTEMLRLHYAYTLQEWQKRFEANRDKVAALYDERFCRMWEFYLYATELGFVDGSNMVFQLLLARERDAVPITRDYMVDAERALARRA